MNVARQRLDTILCATTSSATCQGLRPQGLQALVPTLHPKPFFKTEALWEATPGGRRGEERHLFRTCVSGFLSGWYTVSVRILVELVGLINDV